MTRIVHVSDLHFGATSEGLLAPLCSRIADLSPDLVVISGDLTQRARSHQFAEARDFIAGLGVPVLCIPGNHDIPLWNIAARLICPWRAWRMGSGWIRSPPLYFRCRPPAAGSCVPR